MPTPTGDQFRQFLDMESPNSPFVKVHRGFSALKPHELDTTNLGVHWTPNKSVAETWIDPSDRASDRGDTSGMIVTGLVHKRHFVPEDTPEWEKSHNGSLGYIGEDELLVRRNARVHVTQIEQTNPDGSKKVIATRGSKEAPLRGFRA